MEPTDANRRAWNALHRRGAQARVGLPPIVRQTLGDLGRKRVLHCQAQVVAAPRVGRWLQNQLTQGSPPSW